MPRRETSDEKRNVFKLHNMTKSAVGKEARLFLTTSARLPTTKEVADTRLVPEQEGLAE